MGGEPDYRGPMDAVLILGFVIAIASILLALIVGVAAIAMHVFG